MIDITKTYKTRDGREVRIYATDGGGVYPVHGAINYYGEWSMCRWTAEGTTFSDDEHCSYDLIEVKSSPPTSSRSAPVENTDD
jgi:hypothetical protein